MERDKKESDAHKKRNPRNRRKARWIKAFPLLCLLCGILFVTIFATNMSFTVGASVSRPFQKGGFVSSGIEGLINCINGIGNTTQSKRIEITAENRIVGQTRLATKERIPQMNVCNRFQNCIQNYSSFARSLSLKSSLMNDSDYEVLCMIVEAEAGTEDVKGRTLVANVILNRLKNPDFPNTVTDVVFEYDNGVPQFSPVADGRIYEVTITQKTIEAVLNALQGEDESKGALFFIQKDAAEPANILWFEQNLKHLFRHGVHDFYTYP